MTEQRNTNTYQFPASREAATIYTPEIPQSELEIARQQAHESALGIHDLDPTDIDRRRIESFGASMVVAANEQPSSQEAYFDPMDMNHLVACGALVVRIRTVAQQESRAV